MYYLLLVLILVLMDLRSESIISYETKSKSNVLILVLMDLRSEVYNFA